MGLAVARPLAVGGLVLAFALAGALLALRLEPSAETDTVVGSSTPGWAATERLHDRFGDEAIYVVVREQVARVVLTSDLGLLVGLEGCLSGNVPAGRTPYGGQKSPCGRLARSTLPHAPSRTPATIPSLRISRSARPSVPTLENHP